MCVHTQSTLCNPMDCSPPGSSVYGVFPGKNTRAGCHFPCQGIFPTQGSNQSLLHCRWILYATLRWGRAPGKPSLAGACWAQTEDPSGCGAASPSQGRWDPDSLRPAYIFVKLQVIPVGSRAKNSWTKENWRSSYHVSQTFARYSVWRCAVRYGV